MKKTNLGGILLFVVLVIIISLVLILRYKNRDYIESINEVQEESKMEMLRESEVESESKRKENDEKANLAKLKKELKKSNYGFYGDLFSIEDVGDMIILKSYTPAYISWSTLNLDMFDVISICESKYLMGFIDKGYNISYSCFMNGAGNCYDRFKLKSEDVDFINKNKNDSKKCFEYILNNCTEYVNPELLDEYSKYLSGQ